MAIDYWALSKTYSVGDLVQKFIPGRSSMSPYTGTVTAVLPGIGFLDVQWPFGNERVSPEELVKVNPQYTVFLPPSLVSSYYPGLDALPSKAASQNLWRTVELPSGFHLALAKLYHKGASDIQAYDVLWHAFREADDESLRDEVQKFYRVAFNQVTALLNQHAARTAAYWASTDRKYRATKIELSSKQLACPSCKKGPMRKATYKMLEGQRVKLFACPQCLHLVKQSDILGPEGESVEW